MMMKYKIISKLLRLQRMINSEAIALETIIIIMLITLTLLRILHCLLKKLLNLSLILMLVKGKNKKSLMNKALKKQKIILKRLSNKMPFQLI